MTATAPVARLDRTPRYTSYPTALDFGPAIGEIEQGRWLQRAPASPLSVYLHVPYCRQMCLYCGCSTTVTQRDDRVAAYARGLEREIDLVASQAQGAGAIRFLHWGGGTPSMLAAADFASIVDRLDRRFSLDAALDHAIEVDPRHLDQDRVRAWAQCGVTRASLGVQTFDPDVQLAIRRVQSFNTVRAAIELLRENGIDAISLDLLYGLPEQTVDSVRQTVDAALELSPDRVSLFGYAHVPWVKRHQALIDAATLPDSAARLEQSEAAAGLLARAGYVRVGLDHFAKPDDPMARAQRHGRLRRNFQGYTTDSAATLIGFGASSISRFDQGYVQNAVGVAEWSGRIRQGRLAGVRGVRMTAEDRLRADLIEQVMCSLAADVDGTCARYGYAPAEFPQTLDRLDELRRRGLVEFRSGRLEVPETNRPLLRLIASAFDPRQGEGVSAGAVARGTA